MTKMKKIVARIVAVIFVGVVTLGIVTKGFGIGGKEPTEGTPTYNNGMLAEQTFAKGMALKMTRASAGNGINTASEDSVKITATLTTSGSTTYDDDLTWKTAFKSASAWASGKNYTDYVTVSVAADTHSVTVNCLQAFGEPIIITATSKDNSDVSATCQLDYVKRIEEVKNWTFNAGTEYENEIRMGMENKVSATATFGVGTIEPTIMVTDMRFKENAAVIAAFSTVVTMTNSDWGGGVQAHAIGIQANGQVSGGFTPTPAKFYKGSNTDAPRLINNFLYKYATGEGCGLALMPEFTIRVMNGINTYQTMTSSGGNMWLEKGNLEHLVTVTGINLDKSTVIF